MKWEQQALPSMAPEVISIRAWYEGPGGWQLDVGVRRQFQRWSEVDHARYSDLDAGELVDVIFAEAWCALGRPEDGL